VRDARDDVETLRCGVSGAAIGERGRAAGGDRTRPRPGLVGDIEPLPVRLGALSFREERPGRELDGTIP